MKPTVVVMGDRGMLGRCVVAAFKEAGITVLGLNRSHFDAASIPLKMQSHLQKIDEESIIINCVATFPGPQTPPESVLAVNGAFPHRLLLELGAKHRLVQISTDGVFLGTIGGYTEESVPDASDLYGLSKLLGESPKAMVIRTSIIGWDPIGKRHLLEWLATQQNKQTFGFSNQIWNGMTAGALAHCLVQIVMNDFFEAGPFHLFSERAISKFELLLRLNQKLNLGVNLSESEGPHVINRSLATVRSLVSRLEILTLDEQICALSKRS